MRTADKSRCAVERASAVKDHAAQLRNPGADIQRLFQSSFLRPRAEGPEGGAAKPGNERRMQAYLIGRTPPQKWGPGKGGMKARKNFQREKFFVLSLADVPGGVLVTLPPRAK